MLRDGREANAFVRLATVRRVSQEPANQVVRMPSCRNNHNCSMR